MNDSDKQRVKHILEHYDELVDSVVLYEDTRLPKEIRQKLKNAIYMSLFQIGEHVRGLSKETTDKLPVADVRGVIQIRNFIGHDYVALKEKIIFDSIKNDCPRLIGEIKKLF